MPIELLERPVSASTSFASRRLRQAPQSGRGRLHRPPGAAICSKRQAGLSIGVIAFSEAQQDEIEAALNRLAAAKTTSSAGCWTRNGEREEDGQFVGLLVKNLENIQGDERDVIILSVCYGHGPNGKMLMNFGPINQSGGEKRLNVAFSRAKQHMAVVSSIRHSDITNDYNDGANCLKNYLRYAEAMSQRRRRRRRSGCSAASLAGKSSSRTRHAEDDDAVVEQLAAGLRQARLRRRSGRGPVALPRRSGSSPPDDDAVIGWESWSIRRFSTSRPSRSNAT